jgi:hypothetical protein
VHDARVSVIPDRVFHWLVAALLAMVALILYWPIFGILPLDGDNLYVLGWADAAPATDLLRLDPAIYPEWRPLAYLTVWLEHRMVRLRAVGIHHGVNLALWIACCWLVYRIVQRLTASRFAAVVAAILLVIDPRAMTMMVWIIGRQTSLACLLGLLAVNVLVAAGGRRLTRAEGLTVSGCLLGAALSKEYGLAFTGAFLAHSLWRRTPDVVWPVAVATTYGAMRLAFAGGAFGLYCEDMGFLNDVSRHCVDVSAATSLRQMAYNVLASAIATPVHGIFSEEGSLALSRSHILATSGLAAVTVLGLVRGHRLTRLIAMVALGNALLGFMVFRPRNLIVGECALAIVTGVGIAIAQRWFPDLRTRRVILVAVAVLMAVVIGQHAQRTQDRLTGELTGLGDVDPCRDSWFRQRAFADGFVERVKLQFEMSDPDCSGSP